MSCCPTRTYSLCKLLYGNPWPFWIPYRYQSSSPYKSRTEIKFVVQPHAHVQPIQTFVWKPVAILDSLSIPIKFPIQKPYRNQVCRTIPRSRIAYTNFCMKTCRHFRFPIEPHIGFPINSHQGSPFTKIPNKASLLNPHIY